MSARSTVRVVVATTLCAIAASALPSGERNRYLDEWRADLAADPDQALAYATSVLGHCLALRLALGGGDEVARPLLCRLRWHDYIVVHDNPADRRITSKVCTRCGHAKDDWSGPLQEGTAIIDPIAWAGSQGVR